MIDEIVDTAKRYGLDPNLLYRQMMAESGGNPDAVSSAGAKGLMQLMPATAKALGVTDPFDPHQSLDAGARLMRENLDRNNGRLDQALAEYHGGTNRANWGPKTAAYVGKIMGGYQGKGTVNPFDQFDEKPPQMAQLFEDEPERHHSTPPPPPPLAGRQADPWADIAGLGVKVMQSGRMPTIEDLS